MPSKLPDWITYPGEDWIDITPTQAGLDATQWRHFIANKSVKGAEWEGEDHAGNRWGTVFIRGGYRVHVWGDGDYRFQTASMGKAFTWAALVLAVDRALVDPNEFIWRDWTGEGMLSHPHKYLDRGHHAKLTWNLLGRRTDGLHWRGFPVTNGYFWRQRSSSQGTGTVADPVPGWADWTGDPFYDNFPHAEPGSVGIYSSGGQWRLLQALTALWNKDIKRVLDEELFGEMGIRPDDWDWIPGRDVHENPNFYPNMPGYGDFLDPPYEINGHPVRGGGGWVVISANTLAKFAHLIATRGQWNGKQLLSPEYVIGHGGGNGSGVAGESRFYTGFAIVSTDGIDFRDPFLPSEFFIGPVDLSPTRQRFRD